MKFKIGDKVMLKAVPYDDFPWSESDAREVFKENKNKELCIDEIEERDVSLLTNGYHIAFKYLKHAVKPKAVKYEIDCRGLHCNMCNCDCRFTGTKSQVEAHIKRYWKQPKIKAVK